MLEASIQYSNLDPRSRFSTSQVNGLGTRYELLGLQLRVYLLDWMARLSSQFYLKRNTLHLSMNYIDRYISRYPSSSKQEYELFALASLLIAAKFEESIPPKISSLLEAGNYQFSRQDLARAERALLQVLGWRLKIETPWRILSSLMHEWNRIGVLNLKSPNALSYKRYGYIMDVLDCVMLHPEVRSFSSIEIVFAVFYCTMNLFIKEEDVDEKTKNQYHFIVKEFLVQTLGTLSTNGNSCFILVGNFLQLPIIPKLPAVCLLRTQQEIEENYEDFLCFQTYNEVSLGFVLSLIK